MRKRRVLPLYHYHPQRQPVLARRFPPLSILSPSLSSFPSGSGILQKPFNRAIQIPNSFSFGARESNMQAAARHTATAFARTSPLLAPPLRASTSRAAIHRRPKLSAQADRYLTIHAFFTKQAAASSSSSTSSLSSIPRRFPRRFNSTSAPKPDPDNGKCANCPEAPRAMPPAMPPPPGNIQEYSPFIRRLIRASSELSDAAHRRPTKEELLNATSSWWQRLRIRLKWFTIRGWRRFNTDDLSAFFSWFVVGNSTSQCLGLADADTAALWILIGTCVVRTHPYAAPGPS